MCDETIKYEIDLIKHNSFYRLAEALKSARKEVCSESELTASTEARTARHFVLYTFAIAEYRAKTHAHMFPAAVSMPVPVPMSVPAPVAAQITSILTITPGHKLDFSQLRPNMIHCGYQIGAHMIESSELQLEKFEAEKQKHVDAITKLDTQMLAIRAELRGSKLAEIQKQAAAYSFSRDEIFGKVSAAKQKGALTKPIKSKIVIYDDKQGNTWGGGKGPRPGWIKAIEAVGGDIEKHRVTLA